MVTGEDDNPGAIERPRWAQFLNARNPHRQLFQPPQRAGWFRQSRLARGSLLHDIAVWPTYLFAVVLQVDRHTRILSRTTTERATGPISDLAFVRQLLSGKSWKRDDAASYGQQCLL